MISRITLLQRFSINIRVIISKAFPIILLFSIISYGIPPIITGLATNKSSQTSDFQNSESIKNTKDNYLASTDRSSNIETVNMFGGFANNIVIQGNYAYMGVGGRLAVIDISNPLEPSFLGQTGNFPEIPQDIAVLNQYAFIADGAEGGLRIVDISEPTLPHEIASYNRPGTETGMIINGEYLYLSAYDCYRNEDTCLRVIDISDPTIPFEVSSLQITGSWSYKLGISNNIIYFLATKPTGFLYIDIIDVSDPFHPVEVGSISDIEAVNLDIQGDYAYFSATDGLYIVDISNPTNPNIVGHCDTSGPGYDVAVDGQNAYVAVEESGLRIINIANPNNPIEVGSYTQIYSTQSLAIFDDYVFLPDLYDGMKVININNPSSPILSGELNWPGDLGDLVVSGSYAYVLDGISGLHIIDIFDVMNPHQISEIETPDSPLDVDISGNYVYVATGYSGLRVIDVSNPLLPIEISSFMTQGPISIIVVSGSYAFINNGSFIILDINNPYQPEQISVLDIGSYDIKIQGTFAYLTNYHGLVVVDISDPYNPTQTGWYSTQTRGGIQCLYVAGNYAYLYEGYYGGIEIVDISDPQFPMGINYFGPVGGVNKIYVMDNFIFLVYQETLQVWDISDSRDPVEAGYYNIPWAFDRGQLGITSQAEYLYLSVGGSGLHILTYTGSYINKTLDMVTQIGGITRSSAIVNDYAYVGIGPRLVIFDISDPSDPYFLGQTDPLPGHVTDIKVINSYAYLADDIGGFRIINITDPYHPIEIGALILPKTVANISVIGDYAYVNCPDAGLRIVNISDPENPSVVGNFTYRENDYVENFVTNGEYVFAVTSGGFLSGLQIIDITNPYQPQEITYLDTNTGNYSIYLQGKYVYMVGSHAPYSYYFKIDISDPYNPQIMIINAFNFHDQGKKIIIKDNLALIGWNGRGLCIYDISSDYPIWIGWYFYQEMITYDVSVENNLAFISDLYRGLHIVDIADPTHPTPLKILQYSPIWAYIKVIGNYAYVVTYPYFVSEVYGLQILDITDPMKPVEITNTPYDFYPKDIILVGGYAYFADSDIGIRVVDISDPLKLKSVYILPTPGDPYKFAHLSDPSSQYIAYTDTTGMGILDVSNPLSPVLISHLPQGCNDLAQKGAYVFCVSGEGIRVIDISDPYDPSEISNFYKYGGSSSIYIYGNYAIIGTGYYGYEINVFDINDPYHLNDVTDEATAIGIPISAQETNYVFSAIITPFCSGKLFANEISQVPVSNHVGSYAMYMCGALSTYAKGEHIYMVGGQGGFIIFQFSQISAYNIQGSVIDNFGKPISGVNISDGLYTLTKTDNLGEYSITDILTDTYTIIPQLAGCTFDPPSRTVSVPPDASDVDFIGTCNYYSISGQITDSSMNPLPDVTVSTDTGLSLVTNEQGQYSFFDLPTGSYTITPALYGYTFSPYSQAVDIPPDAFGVDFIASYIGSINVIFIPIIQK